MRRFTIMITDEMVQRINELARKKKQEGLTASEEKEQQELRRKYIDSFKTNLRSQLDNIKIVDSDDDKK
jgi:uncharacterized protein YnzC (UPF0291/DUF896 family)